MREQERVHMGLRVDALCGLIFGILAVIYIPVGLIVGLTTGMKEFLYVFCGIGAAALAVSVILSGHYFKKRRILQEIRDHGSSVICVIDRIELDRTVRINRRGTWFAVCEWNDPVSKTVRVFKSRRMSGVPQELAGQPVRVYLDPWREDAYYLDIDEVLTRLH